MKLSIIIPVYNADVYKLLDCIEKQKTKDVEVIVIDDCSKDKVKNHSCIDKLIVHKTNKGVSAARNSGIDSATGDYITFIDADDMIADFYIDKILQKIEEEHFDYLYMSWKAVGQWNYEVRLKCVNDKFPQFNLCVWNRVYKRSIIGRFNESKKIAEDAEFIKSVNEDGRKKSFIPEIMYIYNSSSKDSLTKRFARGELDFNRIVYYFKKVDSSMKSLVKEFKKANEDSEVILMTNKNEIPELEKYAMVIKPIRIKGTELRGEYTDLFQKIEKPIKTQVILYTNKTFKIGGIETFIYNFCIALKEYYDIIVLYDEMDAEQIERVSEHVRVLKNTTRPIQCDTIIVNRITDSVPGNISYSKKIQMLHACKMVESWKCPTDNDCIVPVSKVAKKSFGVDGTVINNIVLKPESKEMLLLVSATRLGTFEKGIKRINDLVEILTENNIPFIWLIFADTRPHISNPNVIFMGSTLKIADYIKKADYLVQLSDAEGFGYSIVEALQLGTAVLTTPIKVLPEIGFENEKNGYILPFDVKKEKNIKKILNIPQFEYTYDNEKRVKQWRKLLGNTKPLHEYKKPQKVKIKALQDYHDSQFGRRISKGEIYEVLEDRAEQIISAGFAKLEVKNDNK